MKTLPLFVRRAVLILPPALIAVLALHLSAQSRIAVPAPAPVVAPGTFVVTQSPVIPRNPVPVQNLVTFETALVSELNSIIRNPQAYAAAGKNYVADHRICRDWFETKAVVFDATARVVRLDQVQLQELRDSIVRSVDEAVRLDLAGRSGIRQLGYATVRQDVIEGKLTRPGSIRPPLGLPAGPLMSNTRNTVN